jgi:hypothetical protein
MATGETVWDRRGGRGPGRKRLCAWRGCLLAFVTCLSPDKHLTKTWQTPGKHLHQLYACHLTNTCINHTIQVCGGVREWEKEWVWYVYLDRWLEVGQPASERARGNESARGRGRKERDADGYEGAHVQGARIKGARIKGARVNEWYSQREIKRAREREREKERERVRTGINNELGPISITCQC